MEEISCASCHTLLLESYYFCPNCGKKVKEPPVSTTFGKQLFIYVISIFFPPFGLWPGVTYLLDKNEKAKMIGIIAIILTILSTIITTWLVYTTMIQVQTLLQSQLQMQIPQGL